MGFTTYFTNIMLGVLVFVCVAKSYRNRERDEPSIIHRYAEE